jgi:hypothetical protein
MAEKVDHDGIDPVRHPPHETDRDAADGPDRSGPDRLAAEGVDHLQSAASELIAAARSFLDVVEEVVRDRDAVAAVVETLGSVAHAAGQAASKVTAARERSAEQGPDDEGDGGSRVQHIRVT